MKAARPSVRLSTDLQAIVTLAGGSSAALRALLILGAATAGYDVRPLQREISRLQIDAGVDGRVAHALRRMSIPEIVVHLPDAQVRTQDDPLFTVGFEV